MEEKDSQAIIEAMRNHPCMVKNLNEEQIRAGLEGTLTPTVSRRFYETIDGRSQSIDEADRNIIFTPRRVLRNRGEYGARLAGLKRVIGAVTHRLGAYSSSRLTRDLRTHPEIMELMTHSDHPFSLLGKLETLDYSMTSSPVRETTPLLFIPGVHKGDVGTITSWELSHRVAELESKLGLFKHWRRASSERYI